MEGSSDVEVEVPPFFVCPISLQIMSDPVTLCTGISYDRQSIEQWVFANNNRCCPVSKQPLADRRLELTPNHTLRRLIQSWCTANAARGVERLPTPRAPVDGAVFDRIIEDGRKPQKQMQALRELRELVASSDRNRWCARDAGAAEFLASIIITTHKNADVERSGELVAKEEVSIWNVAERKCAADEALVTLHILRVPEQGLRDLVAKNNDVVEALTSVMRNSSYRSRTYALFLLKSILSSMSPVRMVCFEDDLFVETVNAVRDRISGKATKAALRVLFELCPWGRNRVLAAKAGAVEALVELLLDESTTRVNEMALVVLDQLCLSAEGRQALVGHAAGIAVVSKKALRVSPAATEAAVKVLCSVAKHAGSEGVLLEMAQVGVVAKMCLLLQVEGKGRTREKATEILRLHGRAWKESPCVPQHLQSLYPRC